MLSLLLGIDVEKYYIAKRRVNLSLQTSRQTGFDKYIENYTELAKKSKEATFIGRNKELTHLIVNLSTPNGKPSLLIGGAGSGKTSLMFELSKRIVKGDVPDVLLNSRVLRVRLSNLINSLPMDNGAFQSGLLSSIFSSISEVDKDKYQKTILFFDDLNYGVNFFVGIESANSSADVIFVGAARDDNNEKFWDSPVSKMWNVVFLDEQDDSEVRDILIKHGKTLEKKYQVKFSLDSINKVLELTKVDLSGDSTPGGAMKMMDLLCTYKKYVSNQSDAETETLVEVLEAIDVDTFFNGASTSLKDGLSTTKILNNKLDTLESAISREIIGQDKAISTLVSALTVSSLKLQSEPRPVGVYLFLGPTGVGKTQLSKVLARQLFGFRDGSKRQPDKFLRIDMTEFSEKHSVSKLFGAPPGYIGYDDGASLSDFVLENPNCVVLFDEIDKAHPDVLNSLLHIMDEAEIRGSSGDIVSFEEVIILMTSNHGAGLINKDGIGFSNDNKNNWQKDLKTYLKKHLKPEFLNRFDEIIIFEPLEDEAMLKIINGMIAPVIKSLMTREITLRVSVEVKKYLVKKADKEYGARELRRVLNRDLVDPVSRMLFLDSKISNIKVSLKSNKLIFT